MTSNKRQISPGRQRQDLLPQREVILHTDYAISTRSVWMLLALGSTSKEGDAMHLGLHEARFHWCWAAESVQVFLLLPGHLPWVFYSVSFSTMWLQWLVSFCIRSFPVCVRCIFIWTAWRLLCMKVAARGSSRSPFLTREICQCSFSVWRGMYC